MFGSETMFMVEMQLFRLPLIDVNEFAIWMEEISFFVILLCGIGVWEFFMICESWNFVWV